MNKEAFILLLILVIIPALNWTGVISDGLLRVLAVGFLVFIVYIFAEEIIAQNKRKNND